MLLFELTLLYLVRMKRYKHYTLSNARFVLFDTFIVKCNLILPHNGQYSVVLQAGSSVMQDLILVHNLILFHSIG